MRTLIITLGITPQIVTETLFAFARQPQPWFPHRLVLVTTGLGHSFAMHGDEARHLPPLLGPRGKLQEHLDCLSLPRALASPDVIVPSCERHEAIHDLRTREHVDSMAEALMSMIRSATAEPDLTLFVSIAGGRKTMGAAASQMMSLFARPSDRLWHLVIDPPGLEHEPSFWWPSDNHSNARIDLHEIPFVRIRAHVSGDDLFPCDAHFREVVRLANVALAPGPLVVDLQTNALAVGGLRMPMSPQIAAAMALVAWSRKTGVDLDDSSGLAVLSAQRREVLENCSVVTAWAWFREIADRARPRAGTRPRNIETFAQAVNRHRTRFDRTSDLSVPLSRLRRSLRTLPIHLRERILKPRAAATAFAREDIAVLVPDAVIALQSRPEHVAAAFPDMFNRSLE